MAKLWENLPPELLELVLACLPVQVLCRFRLVCRRWNHLITQPGFASLCAQTPKQAPSILITPKLVEFTAQRGRVNWEILDMAEKRFYTLSDSFIDHYFHGREFYAKCSNYTLASDGGLVYAMYFDFEHHLRHIVCNPVSKSFHHIPAPEYQFSYHRDIVVMSVDNATQSYRIIVMEAYGSTTSRQEEVHLYDSTTNKWRKLCEALPGEDYFAYSSIFLDGVPYTLFVDTSIIPWSPKLYSYDLVTGKWRYIDVELPQILHAQDKSLLVVALGRLFFVEYTGLPMYPFIDMTMWEDFIDLETWSTRMKKRHQIKVRVSEIVLGKELEVIKVAEMPKFSKYPREMLQKHRSGPTVMGDAVVALGCGNSVVILSLLGRSVGWDLVKSCWYELPANTEHINDKCRYGIYAGLVQLDLREMSGDTCRIG
ncbi:hypothetical protein M758_2G148400 [Ceratodon purpureus]|nr:hypothetical protein M758_2G148400 [Ceratodon purpureus]